MNVILRSMARTASFADWHEPHLADPADREAWYATALAHALSLALVAHRTANGLTQTALGRRLGMPQAQVSRMEAGDHTPSLDTLQRVADALDLAIDISIRPQADARRPAPRVARGTIVETTDRLVITIRPAR